MTIRFLITRRNSANSRASAPGRRGFHSGSWLPAVSLPGLVFVAASLLYGQQGSIAGPSAGFVFDNTSHVLRGIRGIPGASLIGDPVDFGFEAAWVTVSPALDSALVADATGDIHLFQLNGGKSAGRTIDGLAATRHVVFSPSGTAAVLYGAGGLQMLNGLPDAPVIAGTLTLGQDSSSQFAAASLARRRRSMGEPLAVSDDGGYLLLISGGGLRILGIAGDNRKLTDASAGTLAAFAPGGHDVVVVDPETGLALIHDAAGASVRQPLAGLESHIGLPVAVAFSPDGNKVFVASATARNVTAVDVATSASTTLACDCAPVGLFRMGNVFRLNEFGAGPLWLLDAKTADPRLVFVPAMQ